MPVLLVRTGLWQGKCPVKTRYLCGGYILSKIHF